MSKRKVIIICRSRHPTVGIRKTSVHGLLTWGSHLKHKYLPQRLSQNSNPRSIKTRIENNVTRPEWIGKHRFGVFDLLNYVNNGYRYVYDPASNPVFFDPISIPSITSLYLYDYLLKRGYEPVNVDNIDGNRGQLREALKDRPSAVMISATFLSAQQIGKIIAFVRQIGTEVPIIVGGSFLLTRLNSERRLIPEYERILTKNVYMILEEHGLDKADVLLQRLHGKRSIEDLPNIVHVENHSVRYNEMRIIEHDINATFPQWKNLVGLTKNVAFVRTSQGCAFNCKFCSFPGAVAGFRQRSIESIREELKQIHEIGIRYLAFTDDHFAISQKRVKEICNMLLDEGFDFTWFAGIRASSITEENAELLARAGCRVLCVGLESGDDRILRLMNKRTSASGNMRCLEILDRHSIVAYGSFIIGFPGETEESVEATIRWINNSPLKLYKVFLFYLLPGSAIYDEQDVHSITFFGGECDYCLWRTPTLDALRVSEMVKEFILRVENAALIYSYSPMYAFFPFLLKGYSIEESLKFLQLHTKLIKTELSKAPLLKARSRAATLRQIQTLLKHNWVDCDNMSKM